MTIGIASQPFSNSENIVATIQFDLEQVDIKDFEYVLHHHRRVCILCRLFAFKDKVGKLILVGIPVDNIFELCLLEYAKTNHYGLPYSQWDRNEDGTIPYSDLAATYIAKIPVGTTMQKVLLEFDIDINGYILNSKSYREMVFWLQNR